MPGKTENTPASMDEAPLTIDHLLRLRASQMPDTPLIAYPHNNKDYTQYTAPQLNAFAYRAAKHYKKSISQRASSEAPEKVVALLGISNFDYVISILALAKLGMTTLLLSTRITDEACRHLLNKTNCADVIVQPAFEKTMKGVRSGYDGPLNVVGMASRGLYEPEVVPEEKLTLEDMRFDTQFDLEVEKSRNMFIVHSSGSTGLPKPVGQTHHAVINNAYTISRGLVTSFLTLPLFHTYGVIVVFGAIYCGKIASMFSANLPITGQNMIAGLKATRPDMLYSVPYTLKLVAETDEGIEAMKICKLICYGGSSCPEELGDKLTAAGISLLSVYGSTEGGALLTSSRPESDKDWNYLKVFPHALPYIRWDKHNEGVYELALLPGWPSEVLANNPDGSYSTRDLWQQHPIDPLKWKHVGRLDDTIVLSNGENATPVALEGSVRDSPYVDQVVCVGAQQPALGLLVIPSERTMGMSRAEIIRKMWPCIEAGNARMPAYAKISADMIGFLPIGTPYPATDKGTAIRPAFYRTFRVQIESMYAKYEGHNVSDGLSLSEEELRAYIRKAITSALKLDDPSALTDDTDFFSLGLDSLGAMQVQGSIIRELNTGRQIGQNVVFEQPTVRKLARYLYHLRTGEAEEKSDKQSEIEIMKGLVEKYSNFEQHVPGNSDKEGDYIIVTGATGSLGAHLVAQLISKPNVQKVYSLVRAKDLTSAHERTIQSLKLRLVYEDLSAASLSKIVALPSDFSDAHLGLADEAYSKLLDTVNIVIHCAWQVNFNMDVTSFENAHIKGSHSLMTFCLKSRRARPASFNFCSSISSVASSPSEIIPETLPGYEYAMPMGYAQSKLVSEKLCDIAARKTTLSARVLRIGQVSGDTKFGIWNATEAIPLTIRSAKTLGALPAPVNDEVLSWIPVDVAAGTIIDLSYLPPNTQKGAPAFHVSHPQRLSWNRDFLPALKAAGLEFESVKPTEWIRRFKAVEQDAVVSPEVKLLEFFQGKYAGDEVRSAPYFETVKACENSQALRGVGEIKGDVIGRYLEFWRKGW
ncbi:acetyl-CoA synthetase-like protein [Choiromyces venosus 120613-1]|uniref:Acetyl-CoA synthetase-like protein n=1 Tax=Choiromyces venosus 120613-1 TaxID=1336337 RepID=A0A3N4JMQ9_9PEZI|nr:acetyl-CoA synthetase-like protein [Choiromyces venosus 120613-1]